MANQFIVLIAILALSSCALATSVGSCSGINKPTQVDIENCAGPPCQLVRGTNISMLISFTADRNLDAMRPEVIATALGVETNFPLPEQNACKDLVKGQCPAKKGEELTYKLTMPVLSIYPKISLNIQFTLFDQDGKAITCFQIKCKVV